MSVRFTLVDRQLKLFKHGLQRLQKIGSELLLEALPGRVVLRAINTSLSAYLSVTYNAAFFDSYDVLDCNVVQAGLLMKHVLSVFRTQRITKILFDLSTRDCRATVTLHCENGLVKSYKLHTTDSEILQASVDKQQFAVRLTAEAPAVSRLLSSFHAGLEEVTLLALPEGHHRPMQLNSFIDPQKGHVDKSLYTSVQVEPSDTFISYINSADDPRDVTFNLKDFKAMLSLCDNLGTHVRLWFDSPGNPLVAEPAFPPNTQEVDYEAELILSTLLESHAGAAAAAAAAAAGGRAPDGRAAAWPGAEAMQDVRTPGAGIGIDVRTPGEAGIDSPGGEELPTGGRPSGRAAAGELGLSPAPGLTGRAMFEGATVARPGSAGVGGGAAPPGQSRFAQEARQQNGGYYPQQQQQLQRPAQQQPAQQQPSGRQQRPSGRQQPPPPQQQRPRPSGLIDDGSLWGRSGANTGSAGGQQAGGGPQHPLEGDAGPFVGEQEEVTWGDEPAEMQAGGAGPADMEVEAGAGGGSEGGREGGAPPTEVPSSPPQTGAGPSALPPGAIM